MEWTDVTIEVEGETRAPTRIAQVRGTPQPPTGKITKFDRFDAIRLFERGDATVPLLGASVLSSPPLGDPSSVAAFGTATLNWDGRALRIVCKPGIGDGDAVYLKLFFENPLREPSAPPAIEIWLRCPHGGPFRGSASCTSPGYSSTYDGGQPSDLATVVRRFVATGVNGDWPIGLSGATSTLVDQGVGSAAASFTRELRFESLPDSHGVLAPVVRISSTEWRTVPAISPPLRPYGFAPCGDDHSRAVEAFEAISNGTPRLAWQLAANWIGLGATSGPPKIWNDLVAAHVDALNRIREASGGSVVPSFDENPDARSWWRATYPVTFDGTRFVGGEPRIRLVLPVELDMHFEGVRDHRDAPLARRLELAPTDGTDHWAFTARETSTGDARDPVRIGAIDVLFGKPNRTMGHATVTATADARRRLRFSVKDLSLAVNAVSPAGQDPTERDQHEAIATALVFAPARPPAGEHHWTFGALETANPGEDQRLALTLVCTDPTPAMVLARSVFVLDTAPFLIAEVIVRDMFDRGTYDDHQLDGRAWQRDGGPATATIRFPPQVLGEETIKHYDTRSFALRPYRFSPPATFELSTTRRGSNARELPWNLRRLFGWPGQVVPGSPLNQLKLELLYGLETTIAAPKLRFMELSAAVGALLAKWRPHPDDADVIEQLESRLGYVFVADDAEPYEAATIETGLEFQLRSSREVAYPLDSHTKTVVGDFTYEADALRGGVDWGFESKTLLAALLKMPTSRSGRVVAPALTALGGFGFQKASFENDQQRIYSDTTLGRTSYYALERVGRIGVFWHRAKHVIVYERSAAASEQFPDAIGAWRGKPVVRKVREYVELLEESRSYPDDDSPPTSRGPMLAAAFLDRVIPVDSAWGRDVPGGWVVPLYLAGNDAPPYFRPRVQVQLATAHEPSWQVHDEPEKLLFYTSTDASLAANTDAWPAVVGVDFPLAGIPTIAVVDHPTATDAPSPDAPSLAPGYERFTFRLGGNTARINVAAERGANAIEATLHNLTLARRSFANEIADPVLAAWQQVLTPIGAFETAIQAAGRTIAADADAFEARVATARAAAAKALDAALGEADIVNGIVEQAKRALATWPGDFDAALASVRQRLRAVPKLEVGPATALINDLGRRLAGIQLVETVLEARARAAIASYQRAVDRAVTTIAAAEHRLVTAVNGVVDLTCELADVARQAIDDAMTAGAELVMPAIEKLVEAAIAQLARRAPQDYLAAASSLVTQLKAAQENLDEFVKKIPIGFRAQQKLTLDELGAIVGNKYVDLALTDWPKLELKLDGLGVKAFQADMRKAIESFKPTSVAADALGSLRDRVHLHESDAWIALAKRLDAETGARLLNDYARRVERELSGVRVHAERTIDRITEQLSTAAADLGGRAMRLVRAWGDAPIATGLAFTKERLEYVFHEAGAVANRVLFTPVTALVNRLESDIPGLPLSTVGLRLPTYSLAEHLIPDLKDIQLGKLFPDFAGLKLDNLFSGLVFPDGGADGIKVKHGIDQVRRSAWVSTDVDVHIPPGDVFALGPLTLRLLDAHLLAHTQIDADASGVRRTVTASITGDWQFTIAGQLVATLVQTKLELDNAGKLLFHLSPTAIRVADALQFLTQLLQTVSSGDGQGLSLEALAMGLRARLHLALPTLSTGAFSISNLSLDGLFGMSFDGGFTIEAGLGFATRDRPFNLSILFLGGGGWFTTTVDYPIGGRPTAVVDVGLAVGASLPFDIGVAKGGVWLLLSAGVLWRLGANGSFEIFLAISLRGEVVILGIVSVSLYVRLEARYIANGNGLECTGSLSLKIKIGWFFSFSFEKQVTFTLAGGSSGSPTTRTRALDARSQPVADYVSTYEAD